MKYTSNNLKKITVLYVEDEDTIRTNVATCLNYIFNVLSARNGEEGLEKFKNNKIDLIITDINMPVKDGIEMLEEIKKISVDIPCIITSAYDINMINKVKEIGISLYISKPFDIKELLTSSINLLDFDQE